MNEILEMECLRLASDGAGVGYIQGKVTFVPGLLPGERARVEITEEKKSWQRAKLCSVENEAKERVVPLCQVFETCGGCQLQHLSYSETLQWKERWVIDALQRIGKVDMDSVDVRPTLGMEEAWRYRNKVRLHRSPTGELGYYQEKSRATVEFPDCFLISESMNAWVRNLSEGLKNGSPATRAALATITSVTFRENTQGEGMLIFETATPEEIPPEVFDTLRKVLSFDSKLQSVWSINQQGAPELWWGQEFLTEEILGLKFKVSPLAFLQVNPIQTRKLYATALDWAEITKESRVWDLYCGIGSITLALAQKAQRVWGIEENPYAVEDARINAGLNHISNVEFLQGKVEDVLKQVQETADVVVLDPPRAGVHRRVLERLIEVKPERIVYVSCDPGTLARDVGILQTSGYQVRKVQPVDMFPWTGHVESIIMMTYSGQKGK